jgi:hypothetical protein
MAIQIDLANSQYGVSSRQRAGGPKFSVMIDIAGYGTATPGDDTRDVDFRRYHTDLDSVEAQAGASFLDRCYAWVMTQPDMAGSVAV